MTTRRTSSEIVDRVHAADLERVHLSLDRQEAVIVWQLLVAEINRRDGSPPTPTLHRIRNVESKLVDATNAADRPDVRFTSATLRRFG